MSDQHDSARGLPLRPTASSQQPTTADTIYTPVPDQNYTTVNDNYTPTPDTTTSQPPQHSTPETPPVAQPQQPQQPQQYSTSETPPVAQPQQPQQWSEPLGEGSGNGYVQEVGGGSVPDGVSASAVDHANYGHVGVVDEVSSVTPPNTQTTNTAGVSLPRDSETGDSAPDDQTAAPQGKLSFWESVKEAWTPKKKKLQELVPDGVPALASPKSRQVFHWLIYAVLGLVFLLGLKALLLPTPVPSTSAVADDVAVELGFNGFPDEQARTLVTQFLSTYFTVSGDMSTRTEMLEQYAPSVSNDYLTVPLSDSTATVAIVRGPFLHSRDVVSDDQSMYTASALVQVGKNAPEWWYVKVPVYGDADTGYVAISGAPARIPAIGVADITQEELSSTDPEVVDEVSAKLTLFFPEWAASSSLLPEYLSSSASDAAVTGMNGTVTFRGLGSNIWVEPSDDTATFPTGISDVREVRVDVIWADGKSSWLQEYLVTVEQSELDGKWFVADVAMPPPLPISTPS